MTDNIMRKLTRLSQQFQELRDRVEVSSGGGGAPSGWTDDGTAVRLTTSTDNVGVGTASPSAKLDITGDADEVQLAARANTAQANNILEVQNSAGTVQSGANESGDIFIKDSRKILIGTGEDGQIYNNIDDVYIENTTSNGDIVLRVNDGGVSTDVLKILAANSSLEILGSGDAFFDDVAGGNPTFVFRTSGTELGRFYARASDGSFRITTGANDVPGRFNDILIDTDGKIGFSTSSPQGRVHAVGITDIVQFIAQANATQTANTAEFRDSTGAVMTAIAKNGAWKPPSLADTAAEANTVYYSTTASKLVYKDPGGVVNNLY